MKQKHVVLKKETEQLLKQAKATLMMTKEERITDDLTIREALKKYNEQRKTDRETTRALYTSR